MADAPTLFLIDGSSQMYRAYHAFRGRGLSNQEGQTTHAVYVFVTMLRKLIKDHAPAYLAASFDLAGPTFRDKLVDDYKATRAAMPDDLAEQIKWVHEACEALGVPIVTAPGYEADDVIGTLALRARDRGFEVAIVSIDKDFFQMVGPGIRVYDPREDGVWFDEAGVVEKFGVKPDQVVDVLALVGDTSDNVAGVPGIGKKGAIDLVTQFGHLDALLARAEELKPKQREALQTHREDALRSRELVTIRTDVPLDVDFEAVRYHGGSREQCYELFTRLDFRTLVAEYAPTADTIEKDYALVDTVEALDALVGELEAAGEFAFRIIPDRPSATLAGIVGIAFSIRDRQARYVPLGHESAAPRHDLLGGDAATAQIALEPALDRLRGVFEDERVRKIGHDLKFDVTVLFRHGVNVRGLAFDSMLASYLLDATRPGHPLAETSLEHLGYKALTEEDVCGRGAKALPLPRITPAVLLNYAGERSDLARQLSGRLAPLLVTDGLEPVYRELEMPLVPILADMERAGIRIDRAALARQSEHLERELAGYTTRIFELAGEAFNINSPQQLGEILFEKLQLTARQEDGQDARAVDRGGRARGARADARTAAAGARVARPAQAEEHVHRRAAADGQPGHGPRAHLLQPGGGGHRAIEQLGPEPAEHPDSHRAGARDPASVRRRAGPRADFGGLLADRAASARAHGGRRSAHRGVPRRRGHSRPHGAQGVRPEQRPRSA